MIGLVSPVAWNVYDVCLSDMYLQVRQSFLQGYEHGGGGGGTAKYGQYGFVPL